ncbi:hypothetical protein V2J09_018593 [Rumex salicifolius]
MNNFVPQPAASQSHSASWSTASSPASAFSFISKGWRGVKDSAETDFQLMRDRANSFKNLASSFDRELENFINSASSFSVPTIGSSAAPAEIEFVKRLQPKLSEFRRAYSSPDFSRKVLEKWSPRTRIRIDLSAIKNAIVEEAEVGEREWRRMGKGKNNLRFKEMRWDRKGEGEAEEEGIGDWEPIRALKTRLRDLDVKKSPEEILEGLKSNEFVEKLKSSLNAFRMETHDSKEVPPLDVPELLAYCVRQSEPFLDQLGVRREVCDKIVDSLCSKRKGQLLLQQKEESSLSESDVINSELDLRVASVLQSTGHCYEGGFWSDSAKHYLPNLKRHVAIVTTASLPWMTGTAVNPLFRAAYLAKSAKQNVTLLVPWLSKSDQELVYPNNLTFSSPEEQEVYIRNWLEERIGFKTDFKISFYPGKFSKERRSILPAGDTSQFISSKEADICILEEPEHLNWYHHGKRWTDKFNHVIRLSAATQDLPKSVICNVHGVNPKFLELGERLASERESGQQVFSKGAYFLGKMVWAKGYKELIDLMSKHKAELDGFKLDVYGNGEDAQEVQSLARSLSLNLDFQRGRDHADGSLLGYGYKVFINPSVSDVVCTATAEALAMGKFVVCADHPSNEFFRSFPNCLTYKNSDDFLVKVKEALANEPQPLTPEQKYQLSWDAAIQRFMEHSDLDKVLKMDESNANSANNIGKLIPKSASMPNLSEMVDGGLALAHYCFTGNEIFRLATGAIPGTLIYDKQHCEDMHLLPPQVENPVYGW